MGVLHEYRTLPRDFPRRLLDPRPVWDSLPARRWWLAGLVLLSFVPRAIMALRIGSLCPDGVLYIDLAKALEAGNYSAAFYEMRLNTFPVILWFMHGLGLSWETAGVVWNLLISSLVVLPLFGWSRRLFDDRVALLGGVLYAVHPRLICWSAEVIRDPTFWFFFMVALYTLWRAVTEVRTRWFIVAGLSTVLAVLTRFEGVFLYLPFVLWPPLRYLALRVARRRLVGGTLLGLAMAPLLLLVVNVVALRGHSQWEAVRTRPLQLAQAWARTMLGQPVDAASNLELGLPDNLTRRSRLEMAWQYLNTAEQGLSPVYALFMFGGTIVWWRLWLRREHQVLTLVPVGIAVGMWIHLWCSQTSSTRYMLPLAIIGTQFAALGVWGFAGFVVRGWNRFTSRSWGVERALAALVLLLVGLGLGNALASRVSFRQGEAALGRWIAEHCGPAPKILGSEGASIVINYYARGQHRVVRLYSEDQYVLDQVHGFSPDVVLLLITNRMRKAQIDCYGSLVQQLKREGFHHVDPALLPNECERFVVLTRRPAGASAELGPSTLSRSSPGAAEAVQYR